MKQKILEFWDCLNKDNPENGYSNPITFNNRCFDNAERLGISEALMNSILQIWATLPFDSEIPENNLNRLIERYGE